ncbi:MAG: type II toxin-antitoxin system HicB family antitoxin [Methylococcales bacterium]
MFEYPVELKKDSNGTLLVTFPDVPEAITFGDTKDEALAQAADALESALSFYVETKRDLPRASAARKRSVVSPSPIGIAKLSLYQAMRDQKMRKSELASRLGWSLMQVDRVLDLTHESKMEQLQLALGAVGKRMKIQVTDLKAA